MEVMSLTEPLRLMTRWCTKLPDVKKKKPSCTFSTALLPPPSTLVPRSLPFYLISLSLSRPLPVSLSPLTHSDAHTKKSSEKQGGKRQRHNGDILPTWALRHPVNSHWKRACARVCECECVCESVWGCVCEWVTLCRDRGENQEESGCRGIGLWLGGTSHRWMLMCNNYSN